jgi:hypothetical protein
MDFKPLIAWLQHQITHGSFGVQLFNHKDISDPIVKAIEKKEYETVDPNSISSPIVEAQNETTRAIKDLQFPEIPEFPETDFSEVVQTLKQLLNKETSVVVKQGDVKIDLKSVVKGLDKIEALLPKLKPQEVIDYTLMFDQMCTLMEKPGYSIELLRITEMLEKIAESKFPDFKFNKDGELIVEQGKQRIFFDHKNQNKAGEYIDPLTEQTGILIKEAVEGITPTDTSTLATEETLQAVAGLDHNNILVDTSGGSTIVVTKKLGGVTVDVKTITII